MNCAIINPVESPPDTFRESDLENQGFLHVMQTPVTQCHDQNSQSARVDDEATQIKRAIEERLDQISGLPK